MTLGALLLYKFKLQLPIKKRQSVLARNQKASRKNHERLSFITDLPFQSG